MPNWCDNVLKVWGTEDAVNKWREALSDEEDFIPYLSFNKLLPMPETENLHKWCSDNWGTKWDIDMEEADPYHDDDGLVEYEFRTAWAPPHELIKKIYKDFPGVNFQLAFGEPGNCFAGVITIKDGKIDERVERSMQGVNELTETYLGYKYFEESVIDGPFRCINCQHIQQTMTFGQCEECGMEELEITTPEEYV